MESKNWSKFLIGNFLNPKSSNSGIDKNKLINIAGDIPYITRTNLNNGYSLFIGEQEQKYKWETSNVITIGLDTQTVFYQNFKFYTGQNIQVLEFKNINIYSSHFVIPLLKIQMQKFSWGGNGATLGRLNKTNLLLPTTPDGSPDYEYMEQYSRSIFKRKEKEYLDYIKERLNELKKTPKPNPLKDKEWDIFFIEDKFKINSGKRLVKAEMKTGKVPFIGASDSNNGITMFIANENSSKDKNILGINYNGSVVENFYHPYTALFSDDVKRISFLEIEGNKYQYLFIKTLILQQKSKYEYGYKFNGERMKRQKILLPVNSNGSPDYEYMEQYMKYNEYQKLKEYIDFKNKT